MNIGFVGLGTMGRAQVAAFSTLPSVRICAAADPSRSARRDFHKAHPGAAVYRDHGDLLRDGYVDAIVVAVPTLWHKRITIDALRSGRPVLVEKPMARTVADARRMIEIAKRTRRLLMVAHCRRFDADWGTLKGAYRRGVLGSPVLWRHISASRGPRGWFMDAKLGGGPLIDGAVHDYDFCNHLFGRPKRAMAADIKLNKAVTAVDTGTAIVEYESGDQVVLSWSWGIPGDSAWDMLGPKGSLQRGCGSQVVSKADQKSHGYYCFTNVRGKQRLLRFRRVSMYETQARHFVACVQGKVECQSPAHEAIKAVGVAQAVLGAAGQRRACRVTW